MWNQTHTPHMVREGLLRLLRFDFMLYTPTAVRTDQQAEGKCGMLGVSCHRLYMTYCGTSPNFGYPPVALTVAVSPPNVARSWN